MRIFLLLVGFLALLSTSAQQDTIVIIDYTKVMVGTDRNGELYPVTSLENLEQGGFFINELPDGIMRICPSEEVFIWANGKLVDVISDCGFYEPSVFFEKIISDTVYISFSSENSLADLRCDLVVFEELQIIKDQIFLSRNTRNSFKEFTIISLLVLLIVVGIVISAFPSRISYLAEKSLTLKASAYEFVNTGFFTGASMYMLVFYSLALSFVGLYLDTILSFGLFGISNALVDFLINWMKIATAIFSLFILKWMVVSVVSGLFRFRDLKNYQLFDFLNFNIVVLIPALLYLVLDFVVNDFSKSWISPSFMMLFPIMLILFVIWFTLKFVNNSPRKKLSIISYLCATEIIPFIILLGWFFK